jgi:hypothetical protein
MGFFKSKTATAVTEKSAADGPESSTPASQTLAISANHSITSLDKQFEQTAPAQPIEQGKITAKAVILAAIAAIGGFIFGYESGQIGGTHSSNLFCVPI